LLCMLIVPILVIIISHVKCTFHMWKNTWKANFISRNFEFHIWKYFFFWPNFQLLQIRYRGSALGMPAGVN
jgi:hypothetical protein